MSSNVLLFPLKWCASEPTPSELRWLADELRRLSKVLDAWTASTKVASLPERDLRYSPCFRSVQLDGELFSLTSPQSELIKILYCNWAQGTPDVSTAYLLESLSDQGFAAARLRDLFQTNRSAFRALIRPGRRRGTIRLAIEKIG
jgi:hypothetical protein